MGEVELSVGPPRGLMQGGEYQVSVALMKE